MQEHDVREVVAEVLAEQQRLHNKDIDTVVLKTIATILTSFGIEEDDRKELQADFRHLRKWRRSVEQVERVGWGTVISVIATGVCATLWLGFKTMLGK
jgi:hypothetical protein